MPTLNLWVIDRANAVWKLVDTCDEIRALMRPCLKQQKYFTDFGVYFPQYQPTPETTDLVVYCLKSGELIAAKLDSTADSYVAQDDGQTVFVTNGNVTLHCSEVHVGPRSRGSAKGLANLIVHELMHNKLKQGKEMHGQGGLAGTEINETTQLTAANATLFGQALSKQRLQWMDGYHHMQSEPWGGAAAA